MVKLAFPLEVLYCLLIFLHCVCPLIVPHVRAAHLLLADYLIIF